MSLGKRKTVPPPQTGTVCPPDFVGEAPEDDENKLVDQSNQSPPPFNGVFPRNNAWTTHTYRLPYFETPDRIVTETIEGVEELALFIMHGGCKIVWKDKQLRAFCKRSADNFVYACRYVGWATLNPSTREAFEEVVEKLRNAYNNWCAYGSRSSVNLVWRSFADFDWQLDNWGSGGWVMPVLLDSNASKNE